MDRLEWEFLVISRTAAKIQRLGLVQIDSQPAYSTLQQQDGSKKIAIDVFMCFKHHQQSECVPVECVLEQTNSACIPPLPSVLGLTPRRPIQGWRELKIEEHQSAHVSKRNMTTRHFSTSCARTHTTWSAWNSNVLTHTVGLNMTLHSIMSYDTYETQSAIATKPDYRLYKYQGGNHNMKYKLCDVQRTKTKLLYLWLVGIQREANIM